VVKKVSTNRHRSVAPPVSCGPSKFHCDAVTPTREWTTGAGHRVKQAGGDCSTRQAKHEYNRTIPTSRPWTGCWRRIDSILTPGLRIDGRMVDRPATDHAHYRVELAWPEAAELGPGVAAE